MEGATHGSQQHVALPSASVIVRPREGLLGSRRGSDRGLEPLRSPKSLQSSGPYGAPGERRTCDLPRHLGLRRSIIGSGALPWALIAVSRPLVGPATGTSSREPVTTGQGC
ncbi:hypothetical protein NDU88_002679 [Pleurodeles waltl]|uniref:Uncharacterized protein n=1 Tax=Pleurodeles waltl TaxID=8319 RepID=A0AAV7RCL9_PLEWA|nr:hypothetical protein NDU88_002679 [Pleurodeles waltl]